MSRGRKPLIDPDQLMRLQNFGFKQMEIAKELGVTQGAISAALRRLGVTKTTRVQSSQKPEYEPVSGRTIATWRKFPDEARNALVERYETLKDQMLLDGRRKQVDALDEAWSHVYGNASSMAAVIHDALPIDTTL